MASNTTPPSPMIAKSPDVSTSTGRASSKKPPRDTDTLLSSRTRPDAVLESIRAHLGKGRYRTAQRLAAEAADWFPEHKGIRAMNRGLNQWQMRTRPASGQGRSEEFEWLRNPPESVRGKWVALVGNEMVAAAEALTELMESLDSMSLPKTPLVHRID